MFGEKIKNLRKDNKLTQQQMADMLGLSLRTIASWESNDRLPSIDVLKKMAETYDITTDYLLERSEFPNIYKTISLHLNGVIAWISNQFFTAAEQAVLKEHFDEILLDYKELINQLADSRAGENERVIAFRQESLKECEGKGIDEIRILYYQSSVHNAIEKMIGDIRKLPSYFVHYSQGRNGIDIIDENAYPKSTNEEVESAEESEDIHARTIAAHSDISVTSELEARIDELVKKAIEKYGKK